ncbi:hypothetical protein FGSG_09357 [Fusarium graminearum PH-1]|uniref:hypothetical protein n=1 Tax=Gibberella zeae (strain ATCC MYA-4620 / CBS 123657 / FGSC 9075 / NRRL 31084 / PH-1) TaxID=229533 RepID=UPI00021F23F0|nr:hypothetical protein FGSG_09357 [Fusarium graminearum PH-1]ESU15928.1 hypothetical protein FGSG_09357 [Fusarium graminearum PH-1]|eukprot:XP_011328388.1 hypothetical protein FGSG_09357 [Fusarium graminearum PH-1]
MALDDATYSQHLHHRGSVDQLFELVEGLDDTQIHSLLEDFNNTVTSNVPVSHGIEFFEHPSSVICLGTDTAPSDWFAACDKTLPTNQSTCSANAVKWSRTGCFAIGLPVACAAFNIAQDHLPIEVDSQQLYSKHRGGRLGC